MIPVTTKKDFVRRYQEDEFGNRSPTWDNIEDWLDDVNILRPAYEEENHSVAKLWYLRNRIAGGPTWYDLTLVEVMDKMRELGKENLKSYYISQMAPTSKTLIQGEVCRLQTGLYLRYTTVKEPMRTALAVEQHHVSGLTALGYLQAYLDDYSYTWITQLLDTYDESLTQPSHVVEFSTYSVPFGTIPNCNTVIWEIRNY